MTQVGGFRVWETSHRSESHRSIQQDARAGGVIKRNSDLGDEELESQRIDMTSTRCPRCHNAHNVNAFRKF